MRFAPFAHIGRVAITAIPLADAIVLGSTYGTNHEALSITDFGGISGRVPDDPGAQSKPSRAGGRLLLLDCRVEGLREQISYAQDSGI